MGRELGRISGPLLADNLKRNGNNLAFESKLLYVDVVNNRIGINTSIPTRDLEVNSFLNSVNLIAIQTDIGSNLEITNSQIQNFTDVLYISPNQNTNPVVNIQPILATDNLYFSGNLINSYTLNTDINLSPVGSGTIIVNNNTLITGNLHATGNITWDGNIVLGGAPSDTIIFDAEVNSDILPSINQTDNLGSTSLKWLNWYANTLNAVIANPTTLNSNTLIAGNVQITGNTISDINPSQDLTLLTSGIGLVKFNNSNLQIIGSEIRNLSNNPVSLANTADGYWKFAGTNGLSIPSGNTGNRPQNPEIGNTRFNADLGVPEVYDPVLGWHSLRGPAPDVTSSEVDDITGIWAIVLGL
jgi:hypothetical protein